MTGKDGRGKINLSREEKMSAERREIITWLKSVKFRRSLIGGVDEADVWKKIGELDALYTKALEAERMRYDVLLEEYRRRIEERLRAQILSMKAKGGGPDV